MSIQAAYRVMTFHDREKRVWTIYEIVERLHTHIAHIILAMNHLGIHGVSLRVWGGIKEHTSPLIRCVPPSVSHSTRMAQ